MPSEILSIILSQLDIRALACLAATCRLLWCDAPTPPPALPTLGLVETELRRRAQARGLHVGSSLPEGTLSWLPNLLKRDFYDALRPEALLAVGNWHSLFVDKEDHLHLACLRKEIKAGGVGEPLLGHDWGSAIGASTASISPTLVPSMHDTRIVSVASGGNHCLSLSAEGEVYSWGARPRRWEREGRAEEDRDVGARGERGRWSVYERGGGRSRAPLHMRSWRD